MLFFITDTIRSLFSLLTITLFMVLMYFLLKLEPNFGVYKIYLFIPKPIRLHDSSTLILTTLVLWLLNSQLLLQFLYLLLKVFILF